MFQIFSFFRSIGSGVVKAKMSSNGHFLVILDDKVGCLLYPVIYSLRKVVMPNALQGACGMYCF